MSSDTKTSQPRNVLETLDDDVPALVQEEWAIAFPWLVQGTTTRGAPDLVLDFGLFSGGSSAAVVQASWDRLLARTGMASAVHARQLHESAIRVHGPGSPGLRLVEPCDGHATEGTGVLLTVSTADCVPVFLVAPEARAVGALHAGWRGVAAGVLERGLDLLAERAGSGISSLHVHLGPSICGRCYEVGPEVFEALGQPIPRGPGPIDLRLVLAGRAVGNGVDPARLTTSAHCTLCTGSGLFSHRGGDRGRQVGYIGVRA